MKKIAKGLLVFLLGNSEEARYLRKKVVFKVIPMLNPDGVILGNYRTSFSGKVRSFSALRNKRGGSIIRMNLLFSGTEKVFKIWSHPF